MSEKCMVHLIDKRYGRCDNTDIASYVLFRNQVVPLCMKHHVKVCGEKSKREWSSGSSKKKRKRRKKK